MLSHKHYVISDHTVLSVEFNDYNTASESTQNKILKNTISELTVGALGSQPALRRNASPQVVTQKLNEI